MQGSEKPRSVGSSLADSTTSAYVQSLQNYAVLKHQDVVELFQKYESGSEIERKRARDKLAQGNLRLVLSIAKAYHKGQKSIALEDLIQEGNLGLLRSIEKFDWKRGFKFSTYASHWIRQAIGQHVLKRKRLIRLPAHAVTVHKRLMQAANSPQGESMSDDELLAAGGASESIVKATIASGRSILSLDAPISGDESNRTFGEKIVDETENPFMTLSNKELRATIFNVMNELSEKERLILKLRFGLGVNHDV